MNGLTVHKIKLLTSCAEVASWALTSYPTKPVIDQTELKIKDFKAPDGLTWDKNQSEKHQ